MANDTALTKRSAQLPTAISSDKAASQDLPLAENYNRELYRVKAYRWLTLFPDELVIQEKTVSIVRRKLFSYFVETLPAKDIGRVIYIDSPFAAGIHIIGKNPMHELIVHRLPKKQALHAEAVIEGLLLEKSGELDVPQWVHQDTRSELLAQNSGAVHKDHA